MPNRTRQPSSRLSDSVTFALEPEPHYPYIPVDFIKLSYPTDINCFFGISLEPLELVTFAEANLHPGWREAMDQERTAVLKNK